MRVLAQLRDVQALSWLLSIGTKLAPSAARTPRESRVTYQTLAPFMKVLTSVLCAALSFALPLSAQGKVWVVDALNLAGADFIDLQPAVDAAADGDVILVRGRLGEEYGGAIIASRTLTIAGDLDTSTPLPVQIHPVTGPIWIQNLAAGQRVTLRGLVIRDAVPVAPVFQSNLTVTGSAGEVFVEEISMTRGAGSFIGQPAPPALNVATSSRLTLVHSSGFGSRGKQGAMGGQGGLIFSSSVILHHVQLNGGDGSPVSGPQPGVIIQAQPGGEGLRIVGSNVIAIASTIQGGNGGRGVEDAAMNCYPSADGGTGAHVTFNAINMASLTELDSTFQGGFGGGAPGVNCPAGTDGDALFLAGAHTVLPATAPEFIANSPVREAEDLNLIFRATAGDFAFLSIGLLNGPLFNPVAFDGLLHIVPPALFRFMGTVPATGEFLRQFTINDLGPGVEALNVDLQGIFYTVNTTGLRLTAANPSSVLLLDEAF